MQVEPEALLDLLPDVVVVMEPDGTISYANAAMTKLLGWTPDEIIGRSGFDFVHPDEQAEAVELIAEQIDEAQAMRRHHLEVAHRDGGHIKFEMLAAMTPDMSGRMLLVLRDVSERDEAQKQLHRSDAQLRALTENVPDALGRFDAAGTLVFATHEMSTVVAENDGLLDTWRTHAAAVASGGERIDVEHQLDDGTTWLSARFVPELGPEREVSHVLVIASDITDRKENERRLIVAATHDPLTGLPNRRRFTELAERTCTRLRATVPSDGITAAVLFIDLDGFKAVNDAHGHAAGDAVLSVVGRRLNDIVRPNDVVARFGGDEFVMLCHDVDDSEAASIAQRITDLVAQSVDGVEPGQTFEVEASIGIAMADSDHADLDELIRTADQAMYRDKTGSSVAQSSVNGG